MSRFRKSKWSSTFKAPNPDLRNYFARVRRGNLKEYRTPFYKRKSVEQVIREWLPTLEKVKQKWPSLWDFENDLAEKVGPMSIMKPLSQRMKDIDLYYDLILKESKPVSQSAVAATQREFNIGRLNIRSIDDTINGMRLSTNSGSPFFTKRSDVVDSTIPCFCNIEGQDVVQILDGVKWNAAAVLGWRGQEGGPTADDVKQRVVWMFPFAVNVNELQFYQPAIELCQRFNLVPAWISNRAVDERITRLFDTKGKQDDIICTDFSKFDQHINVHLQQCARDIISSQMSQNESSQRWLNDIFPIKYMIPLAYDEGKIRYGEHGMASGSGGTNYDETMLHRALQYEAAQAAGQQLNTNSMCLGDDGILSYPNIDVKQVVQSYSQHGLEMETTKQHVSKHDCIYLRRWHHIDYRLDGICVGVYSTCRALGRLCEQERYYKRSIWNREMVALRQLSILENCKYHPLREEFISYCMKGDSYRLGLDIPGFLANIEAKAQEAMELMPDFLGYTRTHMADDSGGISSWWIVKYLQSLS